MKTIQLKTSGYEEKMLRWKKSTSTEFAKKGRNEKIRVKGKKTKDKIPPLTPSLRKLK